MLDHWYRLFHTLQTVNLEELTLDENFSISTLKLEEKESISNKLTAVLKQNQIKTIKIEIKDPERAQLLKMFIIGCLKKLPTRVDLYVNGIDIYYNLLLSKRHLDSKRDGNKEDSISEKMPSEEPVKPEFNLQYIAKKPRLLSRESPSPDINKSESEKMTMTTQGEHCVIKLTHTRVKAGEKEEIPLGLAGIRTMELVNFNISWWEKLKKQLSLLPLGQMPEIVIETKNEILTSGLAEFASERADFKGL